MNQSTKKSKNVCMVAYRPLPKFSNRLKIANALYSSGYSVDFICPTEGNQSSKEIISNINIYRTKDSFGEWNKYSELLINYLLFCYRAFLLMLALNKEKKYDYIHVHTPPDFLILAALPLKLFTKVKIILDLHDMFPEAVESNLTIKGKGIFVFIANVIEKFAVYFSDAIICTNSIDKQLVSSRNKNSRDKIFIVMNTPNVNEFKIEKSNKDSFELENRYVILFEGTIWKRRGIQTVIDAVNILKDKIPIYFLIVGDGPDTDYLENIVIQNNLTNFIEFTGWIDLKSLSQYISISDLCVIPFLKTRVNDRGVPNKLFEYTIHDKPIVASRLKGMSMTFSDDEILFFEPGNSEDLADKISWCYNNPVEVADMTAGAKNRYLKEYTWDKMEQELYRCYKSI